MPELTLTQIIERLTIDAANHRQIASAIETEIESLKRVNARFNGPVQPNQERPLPTVDSLVTAIRTRGNARAIHLAEQFGVAVEAVQQILDGAKDRIRNKGAGWLEIIEDSAVNNQPAEGEPV